MPSKAFHLGRGLWIGAGAAMINRVCALIGQGLEVRPEDDVE